MNCVDCEKLGNKVTALRLISPKIGVCDRHYRERFKVPPAISTRATPPKVPTEQKQEETMPTGKRLDEEKRAQILADLKTGMSTAAAAEKHGVSWPTVKRIARVNGVTSARKAAKRVARQSPGRVDYSGVLADLRARRDQLITAIAAIEQLEGS